VIAGRVQGVYYRAATADQARRLAIHGWAKNLPDGRVEVVAAGPMAALAEFTTWLWEGPPAARVESVHVEPWSATVPGEFTAL
jgi:acylphosphatase